MSEQEKQQRIYDLLNAETESKKKKKNCEIIRVFLLPPLNPALNPFDYVI